MTDSIYNKDRNLLTAEEDAAAAKQCREDIIKLLDMALADDKPFMFISGIQEVEGDNGTTLVFNTTGRYSIRDQMMVGLSMAEGQGSDHPNPTEGIPSELLDLILSTPKGNG